MIYTATIKTEVGRLKANLLRTVLKISGGLVWKIEVEFPPGPSGLLHIRILDGLYQVFPASPSDTFHSDASLIGFDDLYLKTSEPFEFVIETWNLDETWDHTIQVRIGMASSEVFMSRYMPSLSWDKFSDTMRQAALDQEAIRQMQIKRLADELKDV